MNEIELKLIQFYASKYNSEILDKDVFRCCEAFGFLQAVDVILPNQIWCLESMEMVLNRIKTKLEDMLEKGVIKW